MIIFRYLARDIIATTGAVTFILLLIILSARFVKYLAKASAGQLDPSLLFAILGFLIPGFLELILPLAFLIAILLCYGRLYVENEMTVLFACGFSTRRLLVYTLLVAFALSIVVSWMSLFISPAGVAKSDALVVSQKKRAEIEKILPRQFLILNQGRGVTYTEEVTSNGEMHDVFIAEADKDSDQPVLIVAKRGYQQKLIPDSTGHIIFEDGYRIKGKPGEGNYQVTHFAQYGQLLPKVWGQDRTKVDSLPTRELMKSEDLEHQATFQWRISIPLIMIVVALLAVPLSKSNPRQGRFLSLLPAILIYIVYLVSLNAAREAIEDGVLPVFPGLWMVHGNFMLLSFLLLGWPGFRRRMRARRVN